MNVAEMRILLHANASFAASAKSRRLSLEIVRNPPRSFSRAAAMVAAANAAAPPPATIQQIDIPGDRLKNPRFCASNRLGLFVILFSAHESTICFLCTEIVYRIGNLSRVIAILAYLRIFFVIIFDRPI
jgi:hypothetical protein